MIDDTKFWCIPSVDVEKSYKIKELIILQGD